MQTQNKSNSYPAKHIQYHSSSLIHTLGSYKFKLNMKPCMPSQVATGYKINSYTISYRIYITCMPLNHLLCVCVLDTRKASLDTSCMYVSSLKTHYVMFPGLLKQVVSPCDYSVCNLVKMLFCRTCIRRVEGSHVSVPCVTDRCCLT